MLMLLMAFRGTYYRTDPSSPCGALVPVCDLGGTRTVFQMVGSRKAQRDFSSYLKDLSAIQLERKHHVLLSFLTESDIIKMHLGHSGPKQPLYFNHRKLKNYKELKYLNIDPYL